jgi:chitin disaccharide deacetylase
VKRLIINADDFGLTSGVNRAIVSLNQRATLTSATLMAIAKATSEAVTIALQTPTLGVGCHIVLVDGEPVLSPRKIPTLVDPDTGRFRATLGNFVRDLLLGRIHANEIRAEAKAQIALLQAHGIRPTHVDTHKHTHIFPGVLAPLLEVVKDQQIRAIRNPFEPHWSRSATPRAPMLRKAQVRLLNRFEPTFRRLVSRAGIATPDGAAGVLATGTLDAAALASLLRAMPHGTWELVTHPGYNDADLAHARTRLLDSRETEREALNGADFPADVNLINFSHLTAADVSSS